MPSETVLDGVTLAGNQTANRGGAIHAELSHVILRNSTVTGNSAGGSGGGIYLAAGTLTASYSTIADNEADQDRDGVGQGGGVDGDLGFENVPASTRFDHSIVAHNRQTVLTGGAWLPVPGNCAASSANSSFGATGPNLFTSVECGLTGPAPIVADPLLGPLQDNGGSTPTRALLAGSPAIDAGLTASCMAAAGIDQRGFARPAGSACDLGAFELGAIPLRPALTRDLNGDREADFVWRHPATGQLAVWFMPDTSILSGAYLPSVPDPRWDIIGSGDFDADGHADLLWRHARGQVAIWLMIGSFVKESQYLPTLDDVTWHLAGTGDFDADGRMDLLWQNGDGQLQLWLVDGAALKAAVRPPSPRDPGW